MSGLTDGYFQALGRVVVNFGALELGLFSYVMTLVSPDRAIGAAVAGELSFRRRIEALVSWSRAHARRSGGLDPATDKELTELAGRLRRVEQRRNDAIHSAVIAGDQDDELSVLKISRQGTERTWAADQQAVDALADEIHFLLLELDNFADRRPPPDWSAVIVAPFGLQET